MKLVLSASETNLLNNASKYTARGGSIELELTQDATMVQIVVRDDEIGIDAKLLPHIFDLFVQGERSPDRAQGGLGFGLALVKNLVERHQGSISASSKGIGAGSKFTVRLPRAHGVAQVVEPCESRSAPGTGKDILIVDDNVDAADTLSLFLSTAGHRLRVAYESSTAIGMVEQSPPDILLLDIGLPDIDGYELARKVRALPQTADAIMVALTGYGQPTDRERSLAAGFNHHLTKPVDVPALLRLLGSVPEQATSPNYNAQPVRHCRFDGDALSESEVASAVFKAAREVSWLTLQCPHWVDSSRCASTTGNGCSALGLTTW